MWFMACMISWMSVPAAALISDGMHFSPFSYLARSSSSPIGSIDSKLLRNSPPIFCRFGNARIAATTASRAPAVRTALKPTTERNGRGRSGPPAEPAAPCSAMSRSGAMASPASSSSSGARRTAAREIAATHRFSALRASAVPASAPALRSSQHIIRARMANIGNWQSPSSE